MEDIEYLDIVDKQFLNAIDYLSKFHKETNQNLEYTTDNAFGKLIYPINRYIIKKMREEGKHIPHIALIRFARHFDIDFNYFYTEDMGFDYKFFEKQKKGANKIILEQVSSELSEQMDKRQKLVFSDIPTSNKNISANLISELSEEILDIKTELLQLFNISDVKEKHKVTINAFDKVLIMAHRKHNAEQMKLNGTISISKLEKELKDTKKVVLNKESIIEQLREELGICNKALVEAQKNETIALRKLLEAK